MWRPPMDSSAGSSPLHLASLRGHAEVGSFPLMQGLWWLVECLQCFLCPTMSNDVQCACTIYKILFDLLLGFYYVNIYLQVLQKQVFYIIHHQSCARCPKKASSSSTKRCCMSDNDAPYLSAHVYSDLGWLHRKGESILSAFLVLSYTLWVYITSM